MRQPHEDDPVLCYVDGAWAYFTTQELSKQWGDDWDDRPFEHNAGVPYGPWKDEDSWQIVVLAWNGPFETPDWGTANSRYSVQDINAGAVAWLRSSCDPPVIIPAGTPMSEFIRLVKAAGGSVYRVIE